MTDPVKIGESWSPAMSNRISSIDFRTEVYISVLKSIDEILETREPGAIRLLEILERLAFADYIWKYKSAENEVQPSEAAKLIENLTNQIKAETEEQLEKADPTTRYLAQMLTHGPKFEIAYVDTEHTVSDLVKMTSMNKLSN